MDLVIPSCPEQQPGFPTEEANVVVPSPQERLPPPETEEWKSPPPPEKSSSTKESSPEHKSRRRDEGSGSVGATLSAETPVDVNGGSNSEREKEEEKPMTDPLSPGGVDCETSSLTRQQEEQPAHKDITSESVILAKADSPRESSAQVAPENSDVVASTVDDHADSSGSSSDNMTEDNGMKACSVKLVDIRKEEGKAESGGGLKREPPAAKAGGDEPSPKRVKSSEAAEIGGRVVEFPANLTFVHKDSSKFPKLSSGGGGSSRPKWGHDETKDAMGKLLSPQNDGKVTISPVRSKDSKSCVDRPVGSVTITKLSTGTSQCVDSKDLKTLLGNKSQECNGVKKKSSNSYSVEMHKKLKRSKNGFSAEQQSDSSLISCSKCDDDFSTKEARKLHTCYSKLDQHFLTDSGVRTSQNPSDKSSSSTNSSPISSLSRGSSRSSSPLLSQQQQSKVAAEQAAVAAAEVKLIKDDKDALMIEGRPKLTVSKVSHKTTEIKLGGSSIGEKKIVAKLKLAPSLMVFGSGGDDSKLSKSSDPLNLLDESDNSNGAKSGLKRSAPQPSGQGSRGEWTRDSSPTFTGKLKIKLNNSMGATTAFGYQEANGRTASPSMAATAAIKKEDDGFAFAFAGKPTYSPSRVEPSAAGLQGKDSPRDASNKDSPASQADSGVFSIASSNSPSKDGATSGTSPDSPNRDRMPYPDQAFGREMQWKSSPHHVMSKSHLEANLPFSSASGHPAQQQQSASQMSFTSSPRRQQQHIANSQQQHMANLYGDAMAGQTYGGGGGGGNQLYHAQQQKYLEQEQQMHPSKMTSQRLPIVGVQQQSSGGGMTAAVQQRQYSYTQGFFNHNPEPPVKRKRGRPRKNPLRDPQMPKRQYVRKKKTQTPIIGAEEDNSVYNFDEEEMQDGLQPLRPRRTTASQKKYSFGSSSDEDGRGPRLFAAAAAAAAGGGPMSYSQQQHLAAMQRHHQMQQQHYMSHGGGAMVGGPPADMSRNQAENVDCSYESEPINKGTSIGIKIKIKRPQEQPEKKMSAPKSDMSVSNEFGGGHYGQQNRGVMHGGGKEANYNPSLGMSANQEVIRQQQQQMMSMQSQQLQGPTTNSSMPINPGSVESNHSTQASPNPMRSPYNTMMNSPSNGGVQPNNAFGPVANGMQHPTAAVGANMNMYGQQQQMGHFGNGAAAGGHNPYAAHMNRYRMNSPYQNESFYQGTNYSGMMGYGNHHRYGGGNMMAPGYYNQQAFMQQQQFDHFPGGNMYAGGNGQQYGGMMYNSSQMHPMQQQQRMMSPVCGGDVQQQPIPPHFRGAMGMQQMENNGGMIGSPRISPSAAVMPRMSPSMTPRQPTPLVSPQSDHSPASHHNTPTHQGPLTPQGGGYLHQNPLTPAAGGMGYNNQVSPMHNPRTPQGFAPQSLPPPPTLPPPPSLPSRSSPIPSPSGGDLKSPPGMTSPPPSLRKMRRPSRPENAEAVTGSLQPAEPLKKPVVPPPQPRKPQQMKAERPSSFKEEPVAPKPEKPEMIEMPHFDARWEELPENVVHRILSFGVASEGSVPLVIRAAEVCKTWHEATKQKEGRRSLWTHLDLSEGRLKEKYRNDKKLESFLKRFNNVLDIKLTGWKNSVTTATLKIISTSCPNLVSLGLASCFKLSNEDLKFIGDNFPKLERLDLSNVSNGSCSSRSAVSSSCLSDFIATVGKRLTHINISNNKMAGLPFVFKAVSTHSSGLIELDISNITTTTREPIGINMEKFQKGCPKLRVLNANHTMMSLQDTPIKEQIQSPGFPHLRELHIAVDGRGYFDGLDDSQIERILKKSEKLKVLDIRGCQHVTDSCLIRLPTWDIEKLALSGCSAASSSDDGIELMVKKWAANLVEVDVSGTTAERAINYAVEAFTEADETKIRKLNLCRTAVGIKPLTLMMNKCPTLEYLNLTACRGLPRGMKRLYGSKDLVEKLKEDIVNGKFNDDESDE